MHFFNTILRYIKDSLFPIFCFGCGREGVWVCDRCLQKIDISGVYCCPVCHRESIGGVCCVSCRDFSKLSSVIAATRYKEAWIIGQLIHALKYQYATDSFLICRGLLIRFVCDTFVQFPEFDMIVPVPLHPRRFAERGFNQASLIAETLGTLFETSVLDALIRKKYTKQQAHLKRAERIQNMSSAFAISRKCMGDIRGKRVLLVDDVYTTGTTMQECASVLRNAGVCSVSAFTLARG